MSAGAAGAFHQAAPALGRRIVWIGDLEAILGRERTTISRAIKAGSFPQPTIRLGNRRGWLLADVEAWIQQQATPVPQATEGE